MRDALNMICEELQSNVLPLLIPTANNRSNVEPEMDCYQLNYKANEPFTLKKLQFLGYLLGWSFVMMGSLNLDLPRAFWGRLVGGLDYVYTIDDLTSIDSLMANSLIRIREAAINMDDAGFTELYGQYLFILDDAQCEEGTITELCPNGSKTVLTRDNATNYISLYLKAYTSRDQLQFKHLYLAFEDVATKKIMQILTPEIA